MNLDKVNEILGDRTGGCDGYGCKLTKQSNRIFMVTTSSDDGGVSVEEIEDSEENWAAIQDAFDGMKPFSKWDPNGENAIQLAISKHSTHIISTSFWG